MHAIIFALPSHGSLPPLFFFRSNDRLITFQACFFSSKEDSRFSRLSSLCLQIKPIIGLLVSVVNENNRIENDLVKERSTFFSI